jgi:hypothetical protein
MRSGDSVGWACDQCRALWKTHRTPKSDARSQAFLKPAGECFYAEI